MKLSSNILCCLVVALVSSALCQVAVDAEITRGDQDIFPNVAADCGVSNAFCRNGSCDFCQCIWGQTFIQTRGQYGKCVSDNLLVYASTPDASFLVQNNFKEVCLYQKVVNSYTFVLGSPSCKIDDLDYRWLWTNEGKLLHLGTLGCMSDEYITKENDRFVILKRCESNNLNEVWKCVGYHPQPIVSKRFLNFGSFYNYTTTNPRQSLSTKWSRLGTEKPICSKSVGCNSFADGSSLVILNKAKCTDRSECFGQKEINVLAQKTRCTVSPSESQYLHNETWKSLKMKNGSFDVVLSPVRKVFLQWNLKRTSDSWRGLLVKVHFQCDAYISGQTEHCVVIKYKGTFAGFYDENDDDDEEDNDNEDDNEDNDEDDDEDDDSDGETNKEKNDKDGKKKGGGKDTTIIAIVCVLVVLFLAGLISLVVFRRRFACLGKNNTKTKDAKKPSVQEQHAESLNPLYRSNNNQNKHSAQKECELYESTPDHVYQYVDIVDHKTAPRKILTYDYAIPNGPESDQRSSVKVDGLGGTSMDIIEHSEGHMGETKDKTASTKPPHKYQVLEEPNAEIYVTILDDAKCRDICNNLR